MKTVSKNKLLGLLSMCGQIAEHKSEKIQEHNMNEEMLLEALTADEQSTLEALLMKLKTKWIADHKEHHKK